MVRACYVSLERSLEHWEGVRFVTLKLLGTFSQDDLAYQVAPDWRSIAEMFHHIGAQQFFVEARHPVGTLGA